MPSALETLVKILKLERDQGFQNKAVIGGLASYSANWKPQAQSQARKPEHFMLVDELADIMNRYDQLDTREGRDQLLRYMMDRITGRTPAPEAYTGRDYSALVEAAASRTETPRAETPRPERTPRDEAGSARRTDAPRESRRDERRSRPEGKTEPAPERAGERRQPSGGSRDGQPARAAQPKKKARSQPKQEAAEKPDSSIFEKRDEQSALNMDKELMSGVRVPLPPDIQPLPRLARPPRAPRKPIPQDEAADITRGLRAPIEKMKSVGPKMALLLNKLGIFTVEDMLFFRPRRYDDYTQMRPINRLSVNETVTLLATIVQAEVRIGRTGRKDFHILVDDGSARMSAIFFGQHWLSRQLRVGQQIALRGTTSIFGNRVQMKNPEWEFLDYENLKSAGIVPVYPLTADLSGRALRRLIKQVVDFWAARLPDPMPEAVLERADLADIGWALQNLHFPEGWDHLHHAKRRLIFDQLLLMQLVMLDNRRTWQSVPSQSLQVSDEMLETFTSAVFPYPLTGAQTRAIAEIRADMAKNVPMNRLLQGDVGSGKTAVAITATGMAILNGAQAAIMAPTSILAEQHYRNFSAALARFEPILGRKVVVGLLTSAISSSEREAIYRGLADGSIDVAIGTHALIQGGVVFNNLALAVIDEQHRFGVEQRGALRGKGTNPHLLVMTATPIPRTLALTMHADLDLSVIDEMPPGRTPVRTRVIGKNDRARIYHEVIEEELKKGGQAFIVYSLVEPSEEIDAESAVEGFEQMKSVFYKYRVGLLHGKMKPGEKDEIMAAFRDQTYDVLVTTSVAEVGVDIPNATVMLIEDANRFGLSQLHQFRGRVGRGAHMSYCLLVCESPVAEAKQRLMAMEQFSDGFKLAEIDWELRGAGDLIGTLQSGSLADALLEDVTPDLVETARHEARAIYADDPDLTHPEHRTLAQRVAMLRDARSDVS